MGHQGNVDRSMDSSRSINRVLILLNNYGVDEFASGKLLKSFEILLLASCITLHQNPRQHMENEATAYKYHWIECESVYQSAGSLYSSTNRASFQEEANNMFLFQSRVADSSYLSFLSLRALKVWYEESSESFADSLCPCGYAWVIWYNLALAANVLGCLLSHRGHGLLLLAHKMLDFVRIRLNTDIPLQLDWSLLRMGVLNNQACICHELVMYDESKKFLEQLSSALHNFLFHEGGKKNHDKFSLNLLILNGPMYAPAA